MLAGVAAAFGIATAGYAGSYEVPICLTVNGSYLNMNEKPFLESGVTYVPIRYLSDIFKAQSINWNASRKEATITASGKTIVIKAGSSTASVNGKAVQMNAKARVENDRVYVPIRFFAEAFDAEIDWVQKYYRAEISKEGISVSEEMTASKSYGDDHMYWLAKIISCESGGESIDGKIGVGNVILNRVEDKNFPNSIYGVIFDDKYGVQFQPVINGTINKEPQGESYLAAKLALEGEKTAGESLYFLNPKIATNFWIPSNRTFYKTIGKHNFYL